MVLLLSFWGEWFLAIAIVSVITGFVALGALNQDIKENPWKYREWLDADEAKKKEKTKAKVLKVVTDIYFVYLCHVFKISG